MKIQKDGPKAKRPKNKKNTPTHPADHDHAAKAAGKNGLLSSSFLRVTALVLTLNHPQILNGFFTLKLTLVFGLQKLQDAAKVILIVI